MKAKITRPDGTVLELEGEADEVKKIVEALPASVTFPTQPYQPQFIPYRPWWEIPRQPQFIPDIIITSDATQVGPCGCPHERPKFTPDGAILLDYQP